MNNDHRDESGKNRNDTFCESVPKSRLFTTFIIHNEDVIGADQTETTN